MINAKQQPIPSSKQPIPSSKDPLRRIYTSQVEQIPGQLSYQNIKLANFLELELADLWDSLQQINGDNFKNQLKESLSRSYNVFHEMKKLYCELGMGFLYGQMKKLVASYGVIFVYLVERLEKYEKLLENRPKQQLPSQDPNSQTVKSPNPKAFHLQQQIIKNIQALQSTNSTPSFQTKITKRSRGIHLFNESYARCIDYDLEAFRIMRQKEEQKLKTDEERFLIKAQEDRKFRNQVLEELNDYSYLKVDGEELYVFINKHKKMSQAMNKISLEEELEKIAGFFKESQHQALEFLRKEKNIESFHEMTEGFNLIASDCENNKTHQIIMVRERIKKLFQFVNKRLEIQQIIIRQKQKEIQELKYLLANKKVCTDDHQTQTVFNFDQELKQLQRRIVTAEMINQEMKTHTSRTNQEFRREKYTLAHQVSLKELEVKKVKETLEQKLAHITKIQRKLVILAESNKAKNIQDPLQFFSSMNDEMKRYLCDELREQGFIKPIVKSDSRHSSIRRQNSQKRQNLLIPGLERREHSTNGQQKYDNNSGSSGMRLQRRQSTMNKKASSNFYKEAEAKQQQGERKSGHLSFAIPSQEQNSSSNHQTENQRSRQASNHEKQPSYKSKKIISMKPVQSDSMEKPRVFDIQDRGGFTYSQKAMDSQNLQKSDHILKSQNGSRERQAISISKRNIEFKRKQSQNSEQDGKSDSVGGSEEKTGPSQPIIKKRIKYETSQVSENEFQQSVDGLKSSKATEKPRKSRGTKTKSKNQYSQYEQQDGEEQGQDNKSRKRKARPSCELALSQKQSKKYVQNSQKSEIRLQQQKRRYHHSKNCSISNQFNMTITNSLPITSHNLETNKSKILISSEIINNNKILQKISRIQAGKLNTLYMSKEERNQMNRLKQQMKATARKIKNTPENHNRNSQGDKTMDMQSRRTQANGSGSNTFKKSQHNDQNSNHLLNSQSKGRNGKKGAHFASQTMSTFKRKQTNQQQMIRNGRSLDKTKSLIRTSQHNPTQIPNLYQIQQQFGDDQIIQASRNSKNIQQFKLHVLQLHASKCGNNCIHLQRYMEIFEKLRKEDYWAKREIIKMHVQDMNQKLGGFGVEGGGLVNFPAIGRR